jgi:hypothetical protein
MEVFKAALIEYFNKELPRLEDSYQWKIPNIKGFKMSGEKGYLANVELKKHFNRAWNESDTEGKIKLAQIIVSDWGGVKANRPETLLKYVLDINNGCTKTPIKGIASYSKIYSITDMEKYAIYDARVACCLNAVQFNYGVKNGLAFNYISGRNNITGHSGKRTGFVYQEEFKTKTLISAGWSKIERDNTYAVYLRLLKQCLEFLPTYGLHDLEMVLFANAEKECIKAMDF